MIGWRLGLIKIKNGKYLNSKESKTMKKIMNLMMVVVLLNVVAFAEKEHHHDHKIIPGPLGGKVLESEPLHAEFFVQADKKVKIVFYDEALKAVLPTTQEVKVIAETKSGKTVLEFEKSGEGFISKTILPEGNGYRVVIQIKNDRASKPQNFRLDYRAEICGGCKKAEYACTCDHH